MVIFHSYVKLPEGMSSSESLLSPGFCDKPEVSSRLPIGDGEPVDIAETRHRPELAWLQDRLAYHPRSDMDICIYIYIISIVLYNMYLYYIHTNAYMMGDNGIYN